MTRIDSYLTMKVLKVQGKTLRDGGNQRQNAGNRYANYCKGPKNFSSSVEENRKSEDGSVIATQKTLGFHKFNICSFEYLYVVPPQIPAMLCLYFCQSTHCKPVLCPVFNSQSLSWYINVAKPRAPTFQCCFVAVSGHAQ